MMNMFKQNSKIFSTTNHKQWFGAAKSMRIF